MIRSHHRAAIVEPSYLPDGSLSSSSEITVTQAMTIVCYAAVSAETRTSVAELVRIVADAAERCCAGRIAGLLAEGGGGRIPRRLAPC